MRSCTEPGSTSETHIGNPSGASTAWMLPPWAWALPEYHRSMTSSLLVAVFLSAPIGGDNLAVQDHMEKAFGVSPFERLAQARCLVRQHRDDLVQVPVGGGPRDVMVAGSSLGTSSVAR